MTRLAEDGGATAAGVGDTHAAHGLARHVPPPPASVGQLMALGMVEPVVAAKLAAAVAPRADARAIAAALGADNVIPHGAIAAALGPGDALREVYRTAAALHTPNAVAAALGVSGALHDTPDWIGTTRMSEAMAAFASGIRWDLAYPTADNTQARTPRLAPRRFAAPATTLAKKARTIAEFGDALHALYRDAGMSLNKLVDHVKARNSHGAKIVGLSKTTMSNACQGRRLLQTPDQVRHFVTACGAEADLPVWIAAWHRAKKNRGARPDASSTTAPDPKPAAGTAAAPVGLLSGPAGEVVHVIQIPVTRGQLRAVVVSMALLGLVASSTSAPAVRAIGLAALGLAAGVTLIDHTNTTKRRVDPDTTTSDIPNPPLRRTG